MDRDDDGTGKLGRKGGWRETFLNRHRRGSDSAPEDYGDDGEFSEPRESRARSLSRPRASSRPPRTDRSVDIDPSGGANQNFDQRAVLEQDRALIEQLTQRQPRRERAVRKPPPPPKISPYRPNSGSNASPSSDKKGGMVIEGASPSPREADQSSVATPRGTTPRTTPRGANRVATDLADGAELAPSTNLETLAQPPPCVPQPETVKNNVVPSAHTAVRTESPRTSLGPLAAAGQTIIEPVVPRAGELFTASDIDSIMDKFGDNKVAQQQDINCAGHIAAGRDNGAGNINIPPSDECTQNFEDISQEFFRNHRMEVPAKTNPPIEHDGSHNPPMADKINKTFEVPQRKALKQQIQAIDSWLEDDFSAREQMSEKRGPMGNLNQSTLYPAAATVTPMEAAAGLKAAISGNDTGTDVEIFQKLESIKKKKQLGERVSPVHLKELATQVKPMLPGMSLEKLCNALRLFASARVEDHDLYLRILGEIPVQVRGISPEMLTNCVRVLWRLRLHEATYIELFSMEAMNMIRAGRRPAARAPRRPPAPSRRVDAATTAALGGASAPTPPPPPPAAPQEVLAPFSATQLIQLGNALAQLGAKHHTRFLDVYQEQLAIAIPRLKQEECELVNPTLAMSQLVHDPLRRAFLERCSQVDAGKASVGSGQAVSAAPDIAQYQRDAEVRKRREKNFNNIFIIEASVRKETFSFFSSLPAEVRTYLDRIHTDAAALQHEGPSNFASQIAAVLDQLGVNCDMRRMAGPLSLHVVAKSTNPRAEFDEICYECNDTTAFYTVRQDDRNAAPEHTSFTKLRHRLLQRLGIQLTHINIWEWQQLSEAQRVNYMVKLQSLQ